MTTQATHKIGFIGAGNMAYCLLKGLVAQHYPAHLLWASHPSSERLHYLQQELTIQVTTNNTTLAQQVDVIVLCVKPQMMKSVLEEIFTHPISAQTLIISVAAGITTPTLQQFIGSSVRPIVRCMPNLPAFVGEGATGLFATSTVTVAQREIAESLFRAIGLTEWVNDERLIDVIAALSGSGPAYGFFAMDALIQAATALGLPQENARLLCAQTFLGAAKMVLSTNESLTDLRMRVTSPKGITEKAVQILTAQQVSPALQQALHAAYARAREIAEEFSHQ